MSKKRVLSKFVILCWATFIAILGMWPVGPVLDTPGKFLGDTPVRCCFTVRDPPTKLTQVQAEVGALHEGGVSADSPQVEVHVHGQGSEGRHPQPGQHEQVCQHDELWPRERRERTRVGYWERRAFCQRRAVEGFQRCRYNTGRAAAWETGGAGQGSRE